MIKVKREFLFKSWTRPAWEAIGMKRMQEQQSEKKFPMALPWEELLSAIRQLSKDYSDIVNLYVFDGWSHADIAILLNIEVSSSRSKLTRAKQKLKRILLSKMKVNHG